MTWQVSLIFLAVFISLFGQFVHGHGCNDEEFFDGESCQPATPPCAEPG